MSYTSPQKNVRSLFIPHKISMGNIHHLPPIEVANHVVAKLIAASPALERLT